MSNDSIEPGTSAEAYGLDDTEPSVATSEQSDREAALAANDYPYASESAQSEEGFPPAPGVNDPARNYVESSGYEGGLADIGLADPELEQVFEESDYGDPEPEYADPENLSAAGNPGPGVQASPENAQFPDGSGNPGPNLDPAQGPRGTAQYPSGAGNPGPGNDEVTDPEPSGSGNLGPNPDELEKPGFGIGEFIAAAPVIGGLASAMPPIPLGGFALPPEPGPDIPEPKVPGGDLPEPPSPSTDLPEPPVPGGGLGGPGTGPGLSGEPTIPLPGTPGLGIRPPQPPLRHEATDDGLPRGTVLMVSCAVATLLALEFISIAVVLGLANLIGLPWAMLSVGATWFVAAAAFGLAGGNKSARRGTLPEAVDSISLTGMRGRLA